ncbi:MAG: SpoIIIAH-like family protein [Eubacteriaceae bacterium]|nr:SpoIIIAH-like family protein [Eubacteriaceae bacterium]
MSILKKKNVVLGLLVAALLATSYVNYTFFSNNSATVYEEDNPNNAKLVDQLDLSSVIEGNAKVKEGFFNEYRIEREASRSENIEILQSIVSNPNSDKGAIDSANAELVSLVRLTEAERNLEGSIKSKGFNDCIVFISVANARVLVDAASLTEQQAAQIQSIVSQELSIELSKIAIAASGLQK